MRITVNQDNIEEALVEWISGQGLDIEGKTIEISMTAGRGKNGYSAEISINGSAQRSDRPETETKAEVPKETNRSVEKEEVVADQPKQSGSPLSFDEEESNKEPEGTTGNSSFI